MIGAAEGRPDEATDVIIDLGERSEGFDEAGLRRDLTELVARYQRATLEDVQVGRLLLEVNRTSAMHGIKAPPELTMLGKTLLNLDQVAHALAPRLDVNATIREQSVPLMRRRMIRSASPGTVRSTTFRLFGYPWLAMILFIMAASGGAMLAAQIVAHDRTRRRRT